jgi:RNA polymerase sigma-70 factor (ECF subfamily)
MLVDMDAEGRINELRGRGDLAAAASHAVRCYGPELLGFLVASLRNEANASDVFCQTCEDMWRGFARFEGRCSTRVWLYTLARHAAARFRRSAHQRPGRHVVLSCISELAQQVQTETLSCLRAGVRDQIAAIRDALPEADRTLLILRVDRGMAWNEIACIMLPAGIRDATLERVAARLRKRFQSLKSEIRARAAEAGLLSIEAMS